MNGKTIPEYAYVLDAIKTRLRVLSGHPWHPRSFICDFEQAIIAAVEIEFPHATIDGCYFHFNKGLWRKVSEVGLIVDYKNDDNLKNVIRKVMALGFLPLNFIVQVFNILTTSPLVAQLEITYPALNAFLVYVRNTYILDDSNFPPQVESLAQEYGQYLPNINLIE